MNKSISKLTTAGLIISLAGCSGGTSTQIDLNNVLDITLNSLTQYESTTSIDSNEDQIFEEFARTLASDYNYAQPPIYVGSIGVVPEKDASLVAFDDKNNNTVRDSGENELFKIEIDGQNSRIIASTQSESSDHGFSGSGLLAGMLIGSMLNRQRSAGVDTNKLASKQSTDSQSSAKSRAGSGSHSTGK